MIGSDKRTFHLIPSGAMKGKELLIGAGVAVDPETLADELALLPQGAREKLTVDARATVVSPLEKELDASLEALRGDRSIGTTRRGIGPAYALRALRLAPRVSDLLSGFDFAPMEAFYRMAGVGSAGLREWEERSRGILRPLAGDAGSRVVDLADRGGSVLFEGSQGALLDVVQGTYPYVTATHTTSGSVAPSMGIPPDLSGQPLGVMKCYATRVGKGPFPTEVAGDEGERIRTLGSEYGATTGRPRRVGWLDVVALKYAVRLNGTKEVALTKLDVMSKVRDYRVCVAYEHEGRESDDFQRFAGALDGVKPVLSSPFTLFGATFGGRLTGGARELVDFLERELRVAVKIVSYGEERSKTAEL